MIRVVRCTFAAFIGAFAAWVSMEWTRLLPESRTPGLEVTIPYSYLFVIGLVSGLLIGFGLGAAEAVGNLSPREARRGLIAGAAMGAAGGVIGVTSGNALYNAMRALAGGNPYGPQLPSNVPPEARIPSVPAPIAFALLLIGRGLGWALIGAFIGLSQGIAASSMRRMVNGAVGGFIGGGLGGCVFEILVWLNKAGVANFPPELIRFISFSSTGAAIGLFIGLAGELAKQAWLVRLVGINEGKQYILENLETVIGRSELANIPVFGDPDVAERHAVIVKERERFHIQDLGSYAGTWVNDVRVSRQILQDRDTITIGKTRFLFREKATEQLGLATTSSGGINRKMPTSPHVCQFCGSVKDAAGNCQCSVTPGAASQPTVSTDSQPWQGYQPTQPLDVSVPTPITGGQPKLVALAGPYAGQTFTLKPGVTEIGREAMKDVSLSTDNAVSRRHARIVREGATYVIYDEGSTNGTYVNNSRVTRQELADGDIVQIGSTRFRFEI